MKSALFQSNNLIGDGMYISQAWNQWWTENQGQYSRVDLLTLPDHVKILYSGMGVPCNVITERPYVQGGDYSGLYDFEFNFDVNKAFQICDQQKIHIAEAYAQMLGVQLEKKEDDSHLKPIYNPLVDGSVYYDLPGHTELWTNEIAALWHNEPKILVSMFSASCSSRQGAPPNKMLPWEKWKPVLRYLRSLDMPLRFLGAPTDRAAALDISEDEYLTGVPLNVLALIMREARLLVTIDNGMSHLAASQEAPTFLMYPACLGLHYILPKGNPNLAFIHMDPVQVHPVSIVGAMKTVVPKLLERRGSVHE